MEKMVPIKEVKVMGPKVYTDYIHMLISAPPKYSVSQIMESFKWEKRGDWR